MILPLLVNQKTKTLEKFPKIISALQVRDIYKKHLDKVLISHDLSHLIEPIYDVHLKYVDACLEGSVRHAFIYNNRSLVEDVWKTIKRVPAPGFEDKPFVILIQDKKRNGFIPCLKIYDEILKALEFVLNPIIPVRMAYGFMRVLEQYAFLLGVQRDDYEDDENWEKLYNIDILRVARNLYDKKKDKVVLKEIVLIRKRDGPGPFRKLRSNELRGEWACMSNRKLFKAIQ